MNRNTFIALAIPIIVTLSVLSLAFFKSSVSAPEVPVEQRGAVVFGTSAQGREIHGFVFGSGDDVIFLLGGLHGTEKGASMLLQRFGEELQMNVSLVGETKTVIVVPIANPDGYETRSDKLNANEVNLNRNFATSDWVRVTDAYDPETYAGSAPFSEVESVVVKQIVERYRPKMLLSYHSQGAVVSPEAGEASLSLAQWYMERTGYEFYNDWDYAGTATKWFTQTTGYPSLTVELTNHVDDDWNMNHDALLELIQ